MYENKLKIIESLKANGFQILDAAVDRILQVLDYRHIEHEAQALKQHLTKAFDTLNCDYHIDTSAYEPMLRATVVFTDGRYVMNFNLRQQAMSVVYFADASNINSGGIVYDERGEVTANSGIGPQRDDATT